MSATQETTEESKRTVAVFKEEDELKPVEFLKDNELLYNKRLMDYKGPNKREAIWDKFCAENKIEKAACKSQRTMYGKVTSTKSGEGVSYLTDWQTWIKKAFSTPTLCAIISQRVP